MCVLVGHKVSFGIEANGVMGIAVGVFLGPSKRMKKGTDSTLTEASRQAKYMLKLYEQNV